jgi:hypothetical protein
MLHTLKSKLAALRAAPVPVNDLLATVDDVREQIAILRVERDRVARAPRPASEIMTALDDHLDQIATDAVDGLRLGSLLRRDQPVALALPYRLDPETRAIDSTGAVKSLLGLMVAANRQSFREIVQGQIEDLTRDRPGMSDAELHARLAEIDAELLAAELSEESSIRALEASGINVQRRGDADPRAALAADSALPPM